jgi:tellurite resistance-related uncharacterized protein
MNPEPPPIACAPAELLPASLVPYRRTPEFTALTVPKGLLQAHSTRPGVWGLIHVVEGALTYRVVDVTRSPGERRLTADVPPGVVEPGILHEVQPEGAVRFYVEFHR